MLTLPRPHDRLPRLLLILLLTATVPPVAAQEPAAPPDAPEQEQTDEPEESWVIQDQVFVAGSPPDIPTSNTVAAKLPLSLAATPASVSVVGSPRLEEQNAFVLGDALENVSGVNVQTGNGVFDFFVVRGLDSISSGLILSDGAPEPETTFYQLYNVNRVEVFKGPSAFLYGPSPLGGTVNLVRKQPVAGSFVRLGGSFGSYDTLEGTLDANLTSRSGEVSFRVNALAQESDHYRDDKAGENLAVNPALTWRISDDTSLNLNLETVATEYRSDAGLPILFNGQVADVPRRRSYQSPFDVSDQDILRFQVDLESRVSDRFAVRNKSYYRRLDWLSRAAVFNGVFPTREGSLAVSRSLLDLDDRQVFLGNQLEGLWRLTTGGVTHNLLVGFELARLADEFTFGVGFLPDIDLFNPVETAAEPIFFLPGLGFAADAKSVIVAPYAVDQITLSDRVQLLLGARFDSIEFDDDVNGISRDDEELSPMLGVVVHPAAELSLYAHYGEAFAPPSTFVVEDRVPEESRQLEVGIKKSFAGGRARGTLALFRLERENIAIPDDNGVTRQTGDQRSRGLEIELSAEPARGLTLFVAYAWIDAELTEFSERVLVSFAPPTFVTLDRSGNAPAFAPEQLASFWLTQRLPRGFSLGAGGRYVGEQFIAEDNAFAIDEYLTFDLAAFYDHGPWRLQLNLENVTDEEYLTRGFGATSVIPAPGFRAYTAFRYTF